MKEILEIRAISIWCGSFGSIQSITTYNKKKDKYKTHIYPHNKKLTKKRICEFLSDFTLIFPPFLEIEEGEEKENDTENTKPENIRITEQNHHG